MPDAAQPTAHNERKRERDMEALIENLMKGERERESAADVANAVAWAKKIISYYHNQAHPNPLTKLAPQKLVSRKHERKIRPVVFGIGPSVVAVSTFMGVQRKVDCSGLIIAWNETEGEALILTSATVVRIPEDEEKTVFQVFVRLANSKLFLAQLHFVDFHHNLAILKMQSTEKLQPARLDAFDEKGLCEGMEVVAVGRDFFTCNLLSRDGSLSFDHPYFGCEGLMSSSCRINKVSEGGPLLDDSGQVVGINFVHKDFCAHPLPTFLFHERLKKGILGDSVLQQWYGLTLVDSYQLPVDALEKLDDPGVPNSVLVKEVFDESPAKNSGVEPGDIVIGFGNMPAESVKEYCMLLHQIAEVGPSMTSFPICIQRRNSCAIMLWGEVLPVSDRKFCCCWPLRKRFWYRDPLYGSQTDPYLERGINLDNKYVRYALPFLSRNHSANRVM